jgi:hypothetical protein
MTQIGEAITMTAATLDECIYCGKKENHKNKTKKKEPDLKPVKSLPASLGCTHLVLDSAIPKYTKANHHIIPVKQCFIKVKRLAQIALSINYDINASINGIELPTVCNPCSYNGKTQNFGMFKPPPIKDEIDHLPYDKEVKKMLVTICIDFYKKEYCQSENDEADNIKG